MARTLIISQSQRDRAPQEILFPLDALERAADAANSLDTVVNQVKMEAEAKVADNRHRTRLYDRLGITPLPPLPPPSITSYCSARRQSWIEAMREYVTRSYPKATPRDDVIQNMGRTVDRAIRHEYPLQDESVRKALCEFALAERTNDYRGEDTSGTQIGNHTGGGLRGLGFSDD